MEIRLAGFKYATKVDSNGKVKNNFSGSPTHLSHIYFAPEVFEKKDHSYEVDSWSLGCILYALLVGKSPFVSETIKETLARIKNHPPVYHNFPPNVGPQAKSLISKLLQSDPSKRPSVDEMLEDEFMTTGYMPKRLPVSCLTKAPSEFGDFVGKYVIYGE